MFSHIMIGSNLVSGLTLMYSIFYIRPARVEEAAALRVRNAHGARIIGKTETSSTFQKPWPSKPKRPAQSGRRRLSVV